MIWVKGQLMGFAFTRSLCSQLTSLCILDVPGALRAVCWPGRAHPPAALLLGHCRVPCAAAAAAAAAAVRAVGWRPAGVKASWDVLQRSPEVLSAATQLQHLAVTGGSYRRWVSEFWKWAGSHPSLQRLELHVKRASDVPGHIMRDALSLKEARPHLKLTSSDGQELYDQFAINL